MPKTEDGEFELVLGNRQMLSIFFIVVVLLGIGFTLGYILGRNSPEGSSSELAQKGTDDSQAAARTELPPPPTRNLDPEEDSYTSSKARQAASVTRPSAADMPPAPPDPQPEATASTANASSAFRTGAPPKGAVFIQVSAVQKKVAEVEAGTLSKRGFPTWVAPNPTNPDLFSVLVGPYEDKGELAKAKASLEQLGFRKSFRREIK